MGRISFIIVLIVGIFLIARGVKTEGSISSGFSEIFTGSPSAKAIWLTLGGILLTVTGVFGTVRCSRNKS